MSSFKGPLIAVILALLVAFFYGDLKIGFSFTNQSVEQDIIKSWAKTVKLPDRSVLNRNFRITIGMNTNVDLILSGTSLLKNLKIQTKASKNCQNVGSLDEFKSCFRYFFNKGSAAERSFKIKKDFDRVIDATDNLNEKKYFIGGNAGLMAETISTKIQNTDIYLIGPVGPKLQSLLNKKIKLPSIIEKDEIHLILEYGAGESFEDLESPIANRFIVSHDVFNSNMKMIDDFFRAIKTYEPDLIILSGLHLLESQHPIDRTDKLLTLKDNLVENHDYRNVIHLELASIGDKALMKNILDINFLHEIDSLGLNEQELLYLVNSFGDETAPHFAYYNEISGQPEILKIIDVLEWVLNKYGKSDINNYSRLTRIHFHCLTFHIIVVKSNSKWFNVPASLMAGSKVASKQASGLDFLNKENEQDLHELVDFKVKYQSDMLKNIQFQIGNDEYITFDPKNPVNEFQRGDNQFYFTPVLVCKKPLKTVGLGDAISSMGLVYSLFDHSHNLDKSILNKKI